MIEHTCTHAGDPSSHLHPPNHHHHHHHHHHPSGEETQQLSSSSGVSSSRHSEGFTDGLKNGGDAKRHPENGVKCYDNGVKSEFSHHSHHHYGVNGKEDCSNSVHRQIDSNSSSGVQHDSEAYKANYAEIEEEVVPEHHQDAYEAPVEKPRTGRNTWPRKRMRNTAHVASIFEETDGGGDYDGGINVETGINYFVSVDDSVCDGGPLAEQYSLSRANSVQRILRNSKQSLLPPGEFV